MYMKLLKLGVVEPLSLAQNLVVRMESKDEDNTTDKGLMSSLARFGMGGKPSGYGYPVQGYPPQYSVQGYSSQAQPHGYGYGYPPPPAGYPPVGGYPPVASPYPVPVPPYPSPTGGAVGKPSSHNNMGTMLAGGAAGAAAAYGLHRLFHTGAGGSHHHQQHGHGHHGHGHGHHGFFKH
ncbi:hypothetical protein V2J09_003075 [Rumex salicifolius]